VAPNAEKLALENALAKTSVCDELSNTQAIAQFLQLRASRQYVNLFDPDEEDVLGAASNAEEERLVSRRWVSCIFLSHCFLEHDIEYRAETKVGAYGLILFACVQNQYCGVFSVGVPQPVRAGAFMMNIMPISTFYPAKELASAHAGLQTLARGDASKYASTNVSMGAAGKLMAKVKAQKQLVNKGNPLGSFQIPTLNLLTCGSVDEDGNKITGEGQRHVSGSRVAELVVRLVAVA